MARNGYLSRRDLQFLGELAVVAILNAWNEALQLRSALMTLGVEEGEIAFPEPAARPSGRAPCFVSETIHEAPHITPTGIQALRELLGAFRTALEGRSIRLGAGAVDLFDGDSGAFLVPICGNGTTGCSAGACACSGGRRRRG